MNSEKTGISANKIAVLFLIIIVSSLLRWFYIEEPVFWDYGWTHIRPIHTAILTEDLYKKNFNILKAELNTNGGKAVYLQEFPLYNLLSALMFPIFGEDIKTAAGVSIFLYAVALIFIFLFFREYLGDWGAVGAVFIAAFAPPTIVICRMIQQTSLNVLLIFANLYFFRRYIDRPSWGRFSISLTVLTLHLLVMSVFMILGLAMFALMYGRRGFEPLKWAKTWALALLPVIACLAWYKYAGSVTGVSFPKEYLYHSDVILNPVNLFEIWKVIGGKIIAYISLPGLIISLAGLFLMRKSKFFPIAVAYIAGFVIFTIPYGHSLKVHIHYLPYYATILTAPCIAFYKWLGNKISRVSFISICGLSIAFFGWHTFYITNTDFRVRAAEFVRPVAARISASTESDSQILFLGSGTKEYRREWEYATGRLGAHNDVSIPYSNLEAMLRGKNRPQYLAVLPWYYVANSNVAKPRKPVLNRLFRQYTLKDSFLDEYLLFDLSIPNAKLPEQDGFIKTDYEFLNGMVLHGLLKRSDAGHTANTFIWKKTKKLNDDMYLIIVRPDGSLSGFTHRVMSHALPVSRWNKDFLYAETISAEERLSAGDIRSFEFYLFDKKNGSVFACKGSSADNNRLIEIGAKASRYFAGEGKRLMETAEKMKLIKYSAMRPAAAGQN